jgi:hypothetical protein
MRSMQVLVCAAGLILMAAPITVLADLGVDFTSPGSDGTNGNWSLGWAFTVNEAIVVEALGFYDDQKNGLSQAHDVGIFDGAGTLIVSGQVQPGDPLISWWRWTNVTPTSLVVGQSYQIAAVTGDENYAYDPTDFVVAPEINFLGDSYYSPSGAGVLTYPNYIVTGYTGWFGPNLSLNEVVVPLPGAVVLLALGLTTVGLKRKSL